MGKLITIISICFVLFASTAFCGNDFYIKSKPLNSEDAKIALEFLSKINIPAIQSPNYLRAILGLSRIADGEDIVIVKEKVSPKEEKPKEEVKK